MAIYLKDQELQRVIRLNTTDSTFSEAESAYNAFISDNPSAVYVNGHLIYKVSADSSLAVLSFYDQSGDTIHVNTITRSGNAWLPTSAVYLAELDSPTFTGIPKAPTASSGTSTTQIATTAFVQDATSGFISEDANGDISVTRNINLGGNLASSAADFYINAENVHLLTGANGEAWFLFTGAENLRVNNSDGTAKAYFVKYPTDYSETLLTNRNTALWQNSGGNVHLRNGSDSSATWEYSFEANGIYRRTRSGSTWSSWSKIA